MELSVILVEKLVEIIPEYVKITLSASIKAVEKIPSPAFSILDFLIDRGRYS